MIDSVAVLLQHQGKVDEAEPLLREALEAKRETLGARHSDTLLSIGNLGELQRKRGDLDAASASLDEALTGMLETLGPNHLYSLYFTAEAARVALARTGDASQLREAVQKMEAILGPEHQETRKYGKALEEA